ncbi:hypothetical protein RFI_08724 [Reticulomyxa filosa]|uniref:Uncharacterized protein n=1 Tax=Reticulomyxa filosa TaxID=46433 RepID=X6NRT1_RETFI|nr:hypothetical protein RFI_08724 [Reticulomyxa filosa]|eukprot:ETO28404.1 hypothetical protein RFI_08724 [Reticulomyxa filosa]
MTMMKRNIQKIKKKKKREKKDQFHNIVKYKSLYTELDKDYSWNEANEKAHEMVNKMTNNKQQGIVVATNINELEKSDHKLSQSNITFSMMINSNKYIKTKFIIGQYSVSSFIQKTLYLIMPQLMDVFMLLIVLLTDLEIIILLNNMTKQLNIMNNY